MNRGVVVDDEVTVGDEIMSLANWKPTKCMDRGAVVDDEIMSLLISVSTTLWINLWIIHMNLKIEDEPILKSYLMNQHMNCTHEFENRWWAYIQIIRGIQVQNLELAYWQYCLIATSIWFFDWKCIRAGVNTDFPFSFTSLYRLGQSETGVYARASFTNITCIQTCAYHCCVCWWFGFDQNVEAQGRDIV